jgi:iron complex transport system permease protein
MAPVARSRRFARKRATLALLGVALAAAALAALCLGRYPVPAGDVAKIILGLVTGTGEQGGVEWNTVVNTRLPRVAAAMLIGMALSEAGAAYQGIFKNPMVSPDLLGVSAGACVGAALGILLGLGGVGIQVSAFACAVASVALAVLIPRLFRDDSILMLVLAGIVVSGLMSSVLGLLKFLADPDSQLADIVFWTMGSLNGVGADELAACAPVIVVCAALVAMLRWRINVLALPDDQARYLGTRVTRLRVAIIACATLMTASAVCLSGTIGWIGLVVPHMARMVVGRDNRFVIPASMLVGALFLLVADTLSRTLSSMSIPISVITGIVGAPLFVVLLAASRGRGR